MELKKQCSPLSVYLFRKRLILTLAVLLIYLGLVNGRPLHAQTQTPDSYWEYVAAGRLTHVVPADVNQDGVLELIVAADNGKVDLLNAHDARIEWSYTADDVVQALGAVNIDEATHLPLEIALVANDQLILLDQSGEEIWRAQILAVDPPPAGLVGSSEETLAEWYAQFDLEARQILPFDADGNGRDEILILFDTGQLQLFDSAGNLLQRRTANTTPNIDTQPHIAVGDLNGDGRLEIVLGMFNEQKRFSELYLLDSNGNELWSDIPAISGHITDLVLVPFGPDGQLQIGVSTDRGQLHLFNHDRQRQWWPRTLNKPIMALTVGQFPEGPALIAGTDVGMVVAYSAEGRRFWSRRLTTDADRAVIGLSAADFSPEQREPAVAVVLGPQDEENDGRTVKLLDVSGLEVGEFAAGEDSSALPLLLDVNGDRHNELMLTRFATISLQGLGIGASETAREWNYLLEANPGAVLVVDFNNDGKDELLIGAQNGRLHYLDDRNDPEWIAKPGGAITHLALLARNSYPEPIPSIAVVRNSEDKEDSRNPQSWLELRHTNGERVWEQPLSAPISALLVERINETGDPNIIVGTEIGEIIVFSSSGTVQWRESVSEGRPIRQLLLVNAPNGVPRLVAVTANNMYSTTLDDNLAPRIATYEKKINQLFSLNQPGNELAGRMLALADNAHGLNWRGIQLPGWPLRITGTPLVTVRADDIVQDSFEADTAESFLLATDANEVLRLTVRDNEPELLWTIAGNEDVTSLYWGDLDGNTIPEFSVGDAAGRVQLFTSGPQPKNVDDLSLSSGVFALTAVRRGADNRADLLVITDNGEVQLFSAQENHPPLLTNPGTEVSAGQYGFNVTIQDIEEDQVRVRLDIQDPFTGDWEAQREAVQPNGNGSLFWNVVNTQAAADGLHYRYYYDDGFHDGFIYPAVGPLPILPPVESELPIPVPLLLLLASAIFSFLLARQLRTPTMRTRRFYRRLQKQPAQILLLLENKYSSTGGSPELLLSLSGLARQKQDPHISSLADGLYLLAERPQMGLPIINSMLAEVAHLEPKWVDIDRWLLIFNTGEELLQTPSMTELSLLLPQLQETLTRLQAESLPSTLLSELRPPLTSIRDSERVDRSDDRLVYLNEASRQLAALQKNMPAFATTIEKPLTAAIVHRWAGLVSAEIEELRGRAELLITLKTKRIIPSKQTQVTFEIQNNGRAPAENVTAVLEEDPAYTVKSAPQTIPFLPPRHTRQITFDIQPTVSDRFRVGLIVTYDDRNRPGKQFAFGDQVNLLLPARDFEPVPNEYRPGTPLRQNSSVFYGRQGLFNFIADNVGSLSQRNVLILIGQRRTGKTSALLNLEQHLPDHLLPVYIDCQSLGVVPGMAALFHDWAWFIADTLATHDIEIEVPEMDAWETDPTGMFQRHFLPATRQLLDYETTLLLVFDEFEVFEHLVNDGILPPTFFNFLRHLMQHSEGLSFVFVGTRRLEEMSADYWSVMFNIALYQRITYLRDESATRLITEPVAPYLVYDDLALDKILRVTAGHPYFLQLVCYTLVKQANHQQRGYVTISDVNAALDEMLSLGEVHFAYLWRRSSYTERAILTAVSHMMEREEPFRPEDFVQFLDPYGFHLNPKEVTAALNTLVEREIMSELQDGATTQYELRLGLVGIWTAQHKSLSKLHASSSNGAAKNGNPRSPKKVV